MLKRLENDRLTIEIKYIRRYFIVTYKKSRTLHCNKSQFTPFIDWLTVWNFSLETDLPCINNSRLEKKGHKKVHFTK